MSYNNPTPVAVCLVPVRLAKELALVSVIRGIPPGLGLPALPGGYVDEGESAEAAAAREMREETAFGSTAEDWRLVNSVTTETNRMLAFCQFQRVLSVDEFRQLERASRGVSDEVQGVRLMHESCLGNPDALAFPLHTAAVQNFFQREHDAWASAQRKASSVLDRLWSRGDIDELTRSEMLGEVAMLIHSR